MTELILIFVARWLIYLLVLLMLVVGLVKWGRRTTVKILVITAISHATAELLKFVFNTPRPDLPSPLIVFDPAFPSAHTALVAGLGAAVFAKNRSLGFFLFLLSLLIGWSRVLLGVHFPVDIIGGFAVGVVVGTILTKCLKV